MVANIPLCHNLTWNESEPSKMELTTQIPQQPLPAYTSPCLREIEWLDETGTSPRQTIHRTNQRNVKRSNSCLTITIGLTMFLLCGVVVGSGVGAEMALSVTAPGQPSQTAEVLGSVLAPMQLIVVIVGCLSIFMEIAADGIYDEIEDNNQIRKGTNRALLWAALLFGLASAMNSVLALMWSLEQASVTAFFCAQLFAGAIIQLPCLYVAWLDSRVIQRARWSSRGSTS